MQVSSSGGLGDQLNPCPSHNYMSNTEHSAVNTTSNLSSSSHLMPLFTHNIVFAALLSGCLRISLRPTGYNYLKEQTVTKESLATKWHFLERYQFPQRGFSWRFLIRKLIQIGPLSFQTKNILIILWCPVLCLSMNKPCKSSEKVSKASNQRNYK